MQTRQKRGGRAGRIVYVPNLNNRMNALGDGYSAVVVYDNKRDQAIKLFRSLTQCDKITKEAKLQKKVSRLLKQYVPEVYVPHITFLSNLLIRYKHTSFLCGIGMTYLQPPETYTEAVHMCLGYHDNDLDTSWGLRLGEEVSEINPTRGFFAGPYTLEDIWEDEGSSMTIERLGFLMGKTYRCLIENGIVPTDIEWIWSKGRPYVIDFGECTEEYVDPIKLLNKGGSDGLLSDFYIPHKGDRGYEEFLKGYLGDQS
jgi:hypothetical protein